MYWDIGDLLNEIDRANIPWRSVYTAMGLAGLNYTDRWAWDLMRIAKQFPAPTRDLTVAYSNYRVKARNSRKKK